MEEPKSFLQFVRRHRNPFIPDEWGFSRRVRFNPGGQALGLSQFWSPDGSKQTDEFDFGPFFPFDNGGTSPYFRRRVQVDRTEAGMYFMYRHACKRNGWTEQGFTPYPLPTPEQLQHYAEHPNTWPFGG